MAASSPASSGAADMIGEAPAAISTLAERVMATRLVTLWTSGASRRMRSTPSAT